MNLFSNVRCRWDANGDIWFDIKAKELSMIQKAALMGGKISIYHLPTLDMYCISYNYKSGKLNVQIYGCELTKEQYESQLKAWNNDDFIVVPEGTQLVLVDNNYLVYTPILDTGNV